jgi:hypothetical protein
LTQRRQLEEQLKAMENRLREGQMTGEHVAQLKQMQESQRDERSAQIKQIQDLQLQIVRE